MKTVTIAVASILAIIMAAVAPAQTVQSVSPGKKAVFEPGFLYVKFTAKSHIKSYNLAVGKPTGNKELDNVLSEIGVTEIHAFDHVTRDNVNAWAFAADRTAEIEIRTTENPISLEEAEAKLQALGVVEIAARKMIFQPCVVIPNDQGYSSQWALPKMQLPQAWDLSKGDSNVIIAVLDEGVNYLHEDLQKNLAINYGEMGKDKDGKDKATNGIDDDKDGKVDNWRGWDLAGGNGSPTTLGDNDPMPGPGEGHGTFVAGCAAATPNNTLGVAGTGYNCHYMPVKCTADTGKNAGSINYGYSGIYYAATHGARLINCSWGGSAQGATTNDIIYLQSFIDSANAHGALVVAAAGNDGKNTDNEGFIPACLNNLLSVGATQKNTPTQGDTVIGFSNYGRRIKVYAPGGDIYSTQFPGTNNYGFSGGTSFACPLTAGIAGLVWAKYPEWSGSIVTAQIVKTCDPISFPADKNLYWGRVNAYKALAAPVVPGLVVKGYSLDGVPNGTIEYLNKEFTVTVTLKNVAANWTFTTAKLASDDLYDVTQGTSSLGSLSAGALKTVSFSFQRNGNDDDENLPLKIVLSDGNTYSDTEYVTIPITGDNIYTKPPVVAPQSYSIDGVPNGSLEYINKKYQLDLSLKNSGGPASITAILIPRTGYSIQQGISALGNIATEASKTAMFQFTRDSSDDGHSLPMDIAISDNNTYKDTIHLNIAITGNKVLTDAVATTPAISPRMYVIPNPAINSAKLMLSLLRETDVTLRITDLMGRTIKTLTPGAFAEGQSEYELPLEGLSGGVYILHLESSAGEHYVTRLVLQ